MTRELINPEVLLLARLSRGATQAQVADAAGVTQGLISKAESGVATLGDSEIVAIADFVRYPVSLFYEGGRVREAGSACIYHRKRKTLPAKILHRLDATMLMRNINVRRLFNGLDVEADRSFHTLDLDEYGGSPVTVARTLRAAWRVPDGPIANLTALIESAGGVVILQDFGTRKLFGMSCWTGNGHPLFFLNSSIPTADLRWTMAHELGHLTMHAAPTGIDLETEADAFAGEFLAPGRLARPDLRNLDFTRLPALKGYWRLSMKGLIKRAQVIGAIDLSTATRLYKQHSARGYNAAEPFEISPEPPAIIDAAISVHVSDHGYTHAELAESVRLTLDEFRAVFMGAATRGHDNVISLFRDAPRHASA